MLIVNTETISGKELDVLRLVSGSTVQSKNFVSDFGQGLKTMVGGELKSYTNLMNEARRVVLERMIEEAHKLGADAIVNVRFSSSAVMAGAAEVMVYGTAVRFK